ncbi:hypothetical protein FIBSPDRAFT_824507 [Athelia psychrophila]|uniref:Prokaryotic-type class I peptide chain release factors domain-containing protein n=1 Tax=Athelia psychrophila TaxID=1759441 RepID=A0A166L6V3_9AGAM|nr:hypothetical protein FIBSPDRAFT_824507 [Fibularhizoctonia sp. CBS 109695]
MLKNTLPRKSHGLFLTCRASLFAVTGITRAASSSSPGPLSVAPRLSALTTSSETDEARGWIARFKSQSIQRGAVEMSFSRSSGPGGQNVNKVNTKATLRCRVDLPWIPMWSVPELKKSPYYTTSSQAILITSTVFRSQSQNVDDCLSKLHNLIISAATAPIVNEPSEAQQARVRGLERADAARKKVEKNKRSEVKAGRASGKRGDW